MIRILPDDEEDQLGIVGLPKSLQRIPRFQNHDNVEVSDSEFTPPSPKQTFPPPEEPGAPVDFPGMVLPNPDHIQPRLDTEGQPPDPTTIDSKMTYVNAPKIGAPSPNQGINVPPVSPQYQRDLGTAENLSRGSGLDQFQQKHHIAGGILRALDIAGSILAPNLAVNIPGTTLHHQELEAQNRGDITRDIQNQERQVQTGHQQAETENVQSETALRNKQLENLDRPQSSIEKLQDGSIVQLTTDKDTGETTAHLVYKGDPKIETEVRQVMKGGKPRQVLFNKNTGQEIKDLGEAPPPPTLLTQETFSNLSPAEVEAAGLPKGTVAQRGSRGEIKVINKGDDAKRAADETALAGTTADLDRLASAANELLNHPGLGGITGIRGKIPNIPGGDAANAQAKLDALKSQVAFGVLQNMRNQSKTGGALGAVSDREGKLLESNLAALDTAQSEAEFKKSLQKIIDYTDQAKDRARNALGRTYGEPNNATTPTGKGPAVGAVEDGYRFKGGDPSKPESWERIH